MRRKVVLFCLLLAVVQRALGQGIIGSTLPCEAPGEDPDPTNPEDNFSCPIQDQSQLRCYSRAELCNGSPFCSGGTDESANIVSLECNNGIFVCTPGLNIPLIQLCDGVNNCGNGDDETTTLCENKCLAPYYGGCSYTRQCITSEFDVNCGGCLSGFAVNPSNLAGPCLVEIGFERTTYTGSETDEITEEICAVILANPAAFVGGSLQGTFDNISISTINGLITPQQTTGPNAATAIVDFSTQPMTVTLSPTQLRDCVRVPIVDDSILDPNEVFNVELTTGTPGVVVRPGLDLAQVTITDNDEQVTAVYQLPTYPVAENVPSGVVQACVAIVSAAANVLTATSTVTITFANGPPPSATMDVDYTPMATPATLVFNAGSSVTDNPSTSSFQCFTVPIINDNDVEGNENFLLGLTGPSGLIVVDPNRPDSTATVIIIEDDRPLIGFQQLVYSTDEEGGMFLDVCVELLSSGTHPNPIPFSMSTAPGTAVAPMDYIAFAGRQLSFAANSNMGDIVCTSIEIVNDDVLEANLEEFFADITSTAADIAIGRDRATIRLIESNDGIVYRFENPSYVIAEANTIQEVCIVRDPANAPSQDIQINLQTSPNTASAGLDYQPLTTVLTFAPNDLRQCANVMILDDAIVEPNEVINLFASLVTPNPLVTVENTATITITDADVVSVRITPPPNFNVPENGGPASVCVEIVSGSLAAGVSVTVNLATTGGSAQQPEDYIMQNEDIVFNAANMNMMLCITIPIVDDLLCEASETIITQLTENDPNVVLIPPTTSIVTIIDNDVAVITLNVVGPAMFQGVLQECADEGLWFRLDFDNNVTKGANQVCVISVMTEDGSAVAGSDYSALTDSCTFTDTNTFCDFHIDVLDDFTAEMDETFNIILASQDPSRCIVDDNNRTVTIIDDEDCDDDVCGEFEICEELMCPNNFTCIPEGVGDDPHFAVTLSSGKTLCYTVQGEHGFAFNLISNEKLYMNAMFVPDARREEVTWLGTMGIVVNNNGYKKSNMTKLRFEAIKNTIHIDNQMVLEARNIEKITLENGKLTISEAPPTEGYKTPFVRIDLKDVELSFSIKFMTEHLDLYWHSTGQKTVDSHGLIGQFFHHDVAVDEVRKMLILPGKEPVPIQRKPLWAFMEREVGDSTNFCWVAMNPGYQGEGLIDGSYFDYLVDDVLSTQFKFKKL